MTTWVALLRGINVGGKNKVPMDGLREVFSRELGFDDVRTYIQSGNVVFRGPDEVAVDSDRLAAAVNDRFGLGIVVVVRTAAQLRDALAADPFPDADRSQVHIGFMSRPPQAAAVEQVDRVAFVPEEFAVRGRELYLHLPNGQGRAKLPAALDRRLKVPTTARNWRTVTALVELVGG